MLLLIMVVDVAVCCLRLCPVMLRAADRLEAACRIERWLKMLLRRLPQPRCCSFGTSDDDDGELVAVAALAVAADVADADVALAVVTNMPPPLWLCCCWHCHCCEAVSVPALQRLSRSRSCQSS